MANYIVIFFIYSFLGWAMETIGECIKSKKFINRGFLIGPYCPVYGLGVVLITALLKKYINDIPVMFCMSILICGTLEYFTSYIMEKFFNARWWDYHNLKFNINGRICLETLIPFGVVGLVLVKYVNPFLINLTKKIPNNVFNVILILLCIVFVIDVIVSLIVIWSFRKTTKQVAKDNTEEISEKVREITTEKVEEISERVKESATQKIEDFSEKAENISKKVKKATTEKVEIIKGKATDAINDVKSNLEDMNNKIKAKAKELKDGENKIFTEKVKEILANKSWLTKRLTKAFPNLEVKIKEKK